MDTYTIADVFYAGIITLVVATVVLVCSFIYERIRNPPLKHPECHCPAESECEDAAFDPKTNTCNWYDWEHDDCIWEPESYE